MILSFFGSLRIACILAVGVFLTGCEDPFDCIVDDRPVLHSDEVSQPILNQEYTSRFRVSIQNNGDDDRYIYKWTVEGGFPPGISYRVEDRALFFSGTPTALGDYAYTLSVHVSDDFGEFGAEGINASKLCRQNVSRDYIMTVAPM